MRETKSATHVRHHKVLSCQSVHALHSSSANFYMLLVGHECSLCTLKCTAATEGVYIHYSSVLGPIPRPMHGEVLEPVSIASKEQR